MKALFRGISKLVKVAIIVGILIMAVKLCQKMELDLPGLKSQVKKISQSINIKSISNGSGASAKMDDIVMKVGNKSVDYNEILIYIYFLKHAYEPSLGTGIWEFKLTGKDNFQDYAKKEIINQVSQIKTIVQKAEQESVTLSEEEKEEIKDMAIRYVDTVKEADKKTYGITVEKVAQIYEDNQLASKMFDIATNQVNTNISDEEARQIKIQYLMLMTNGNDKNGNKINLSQAAAVSAKTKAQNLLKKAKQTGSFYSFALQNTDAKEVELTFGKSNMPAEFGEEALKLTSGKFSGVIEGRSGYYILYCVSDFDKDATKARKEEIITERQDALFQSQFKEWSSHYKVKLSRGFWS